MAFIKPAFPRLQRGKLVSNGLVGAWPFYEGSGPTLHDVSGNRSHGTLNGGAAWIGGLHGWSLDFNGIDGWVDTGFLPPTGSDNRAFTFWIKPKSSWDTGPSDNNGRHILEYGINNTLARYSIKRSNGSVLRIEFNGAAYVSSLEMPTGEWSFVSVALNGTTVGDHELSVNGVVEQASGSGVINTGSATNLAIGRDIALENGRYTDGIIDDVRVYNRALSAQEIKLIAAGLG